MAIDVKWDEGACSAVPPPGDVHVREAAHALANDRTVQPRGTI